MFLSNAAALKPDVVILDVSMPSLNGLSTLYELKRLIPDVRVIILTMNEDPDIAAESFRAWRVGLRAEALGCSPNCPRPCSK